MLPRLLAAAAPPGNSAHENRRQCLKASEGNLFPPRTYLKHFLFYFILAFVVSCTSKSYGFYFVLISVLVIGLEALVGKKDPSRTSNTSPYAGTGFPWCWFFRWRLL